MHTLLFRRKLAHRLHVCATRRRARVGNPSADDLNGAALLDQIARDLDGLPQPIVDEVARRCDDPAFARRFEDVFFALPEVLGVSQVPASGVDLVRWMIVQTDRGAAMPERRTWPLSHGAQLGRPIGRTVWRHDSIVLSTADDFTGAFAVVAPLLAVWEVATAIGQWRDQAFVASHPAISATVIAVGTGEAGRAGVPPVTETLAFTPVGARTACRVPVHLGSRRPDVVGQTVTVVPRSGDCEAPLVPAAIGDPSASILVAFAFLASGVVSAKAWFWLRRNYTCPRRSTAPSHPMTMRIAR